ncbi:hypothetical protein SISNIDRAFT_468041 [Sistotremastrum niveocremeum HHB9708]|uniref:F-box domain-containing protein n=1 Tax=Sistotremastrum niveocremeum HHB9708 TaxID=1314777 RepID=A0A164S3E9_9AGAM|nr:hypothetical protein SISNIDRAFT_468041 [Sistotremastrum niveocremeum HHB9708]
MPPRKVIRAIPVTFHPNIAQWLVVDCPKRDLVSLSCASRAWQVQAEQILWTECSLDMPASPNTPNLDTIIRRFKKHIGNLTIWVKESFQSTAFAASRGVTNLEKLIIGMDFEKDDTVVPPGGWFMEPLENLKVLSLPDNGDPELSTLIVEPEAFPALEELYNMQFDNQFTTLSRKEIAKFLKLRLKFPALRVLRASVRARVLSAHIAREIITAMRDLEAMAITVYDAPDSDSGEDFGNPGPRLMHGPIPPELFRLVTTFLADDCSKRDLVSLSCVCSAWQAEAERVLWESGSFEIPCLTLDGADFRAFEALCKKSKYIKHVLVRVLDEANDDDDDVHVTMALEFLEKVKDQLDALTFHIPGRQSPDLVCRILDSWTFSHLHQLQIICRPEGCTSDEYAEELCSFISRHEIYDFGLFDTESASTMEMLAEDDDFVTDLAVLRTTVAAAFQILPFTPNLEQLSIERSWDEEAEVPEGLVMPPLALDSLRVLCLPDDNRAALSDVLIRPESLPNLEEVYNWRLTRRLGNKPHSALDAYLKDRFNFPSLKILTGRPFMKEEARPSFWLGQSTEYMTKRETKASTIRINDSHHQDPQFFQVLWYNFSGPYDNAMAEFDEAQASIDLCDVWEILNSENSKANIRPHSIFYWTTIPLPPNLVLLFDRCLVAIMYSGRDQLVGARQPTAEPDLDLSSRLSEFLSVNALRGAVRAEEIGFCNLTASQSWNINVWLYRNIADCLSEDSRNRDLISLACASRTWQTEAERILWTNCQIDIPDHIHARDLDVIFERFEPHIENLTIYVWDSNGDIGDGRLDDMQIAFLQDLSPRIKRLTVHIRTALPCAIPRELFELTIFDFAVLETFQMTGSPRGNEFGFYRAIPAFLNRHPVKELALYDQEGEEVLGSFEDDGPEFARKLEVLRTTAAGALVAVPHVPNLQKLVVGMHSEDISGDTTGTWLMSPLDKLRVLCLPEEGDERLARNFADPECLPQLEELHNMRFGELFWVESQQRITQYLQTRFSFPLLRILTTSLVARSLSAYDARLVFTAIRASCPNLQYLELTSTGDRFCWAEATLRIDGDLHIVLHKTRTPPLSSPMDLEWVANEAFKEDDDDDMDMI